MKRIFYHLFFLLNVLLLLTSCAGSSKPTLKVAATSIPHAEILEYVKPNLREQNIELEILIVDDFNTPNRALADQEVDANFFQHFPFLEAQQADFGYALESFAAIHIEPMALYSKRMNSIDEIKEEAKIAIPSDPSNQARALALCEHLGLITLKNRESKTSLLDITYNPHHLHFIEMDSPLLSRALEDVDAALMSTNFALLAHLSPQRDALAVEGTQSRFVNLLVIRQGEGQRPDLQALKAAMTTDQVRQFMQERYQGAVFPAF